MPLFMDVHRKVNASPEEVAHAHEQDLQKQQAHGVQFLRYWHDQKDGTIFCLSEAPSRDALEAVHREAHGLMPTEVHQVDQGT